MLLSALHGVLGREEKAQKGPIKSVMYGPEGLHQH